MPGNDGIVCSSCGKTAPGYAVYCPHCKSRLKSGQKVALGVQNKHGSSPSFLTKVVKYFYIFCLGSWVVITLTSGKVVSAILFLTALLLMLEWVRRKIAEHVPLKTPLVYPLASVILMFIAMSSAGEMSGISTASAPPVQEKKPQATAAPTIKPSPKTSQTAQKPVKTLTHDDSTNLAQATTTEWLGANLESRKNVIVGAFGLYAIDTERFQGFDAPDSKTDFAQQEQKMLACIDHMSQSLEDEKKSLPVMMVVNTCATMENIITGFEQ